MTFKPFNVGKWFVLGFIAWLATLGEGGASFNFPDFGGRRGRPPAPLPAPLPMPRPGAPAAPAPVPVEPPDPVLQWIKTHILEAIMIGLAILLVIVAIVLLVMWINSRGRFMFLHAIATNTFQVVAPWKQYRELANSLLGFRVCLAVVGCVVMGVIGGAGLLLAWPDIRAGQFRQSSVFAILLGVLVLLPSMLFLAVVNWCTLSFISTIMYARGVRVMQAWDEFRRDVLPGHIGKFVLFLLMNIVLGIGLGLGQLLVGCATCCIGLLPYLNTVLTLPLVLFVHCYAIYFLQQFGPQYQIIQEVPPPPTGAFPVIGVQYPPPPPLRP
jgi:hypothetical protein